MKKLLLFVLVFAALGGWFLYSEIYSVEAREAERVTFEVKQGESVAALAKRLDEEGVIRNAWLFRKYVGWKDIDTQIRFGTYEVTAPVTLARVVASLAHPSMSEREITILPGWNLRDIGDYIEKEGIATKEDFFALVGEPVVRYSGASAPDLGLDVRVLADKPNTVSYEGYLAPDTYRIYMDASIEDVVHRLIKERDRQFTDELYRDIARAGRTPYEVLTLASIVEREVRSPEDRAMVADIFWRRYDLNWALQADSTVHYVVNKKGNVFTTAADRATDSPWNTYAYPGLPLGPISTPSLSSIMATVYPEENDYWYFLTDMDGHVKYAKTLAEHNQNVQTYLR